MDEDDIRELNDKNTDGYLNNVVVGLEDNCFGILVVDNSTEFTYQLFYISGKKLEGYLLQLSVNNPNRDDLVFMFASRIANRFNHLDSINVFNIFQQHTRSALEKENYFTVSSLGLERFNDYSATMIAIGVKNIIVLEFIDKVDFLREYYGASHSTKTVENGTYIYLMLNKRNGLSKIGMSIKPIFRERTLQSQEPEVFLIAYWQAPESIERELHKLFKAVRKRGEWFNLKSKDFRQLKERMEEYNIR